MLPPLTITIITQHKFIADCFIGLMT